MSCTVLEKALDGLVKNFHQYSRLDKDSDRLNKSEFLALIKESYPKFLEACNRNNPGSLDKMFSDNDKDHDGAVNFMEFAGMLGVLANDYHNQYHGNPRCGNKPCDDKRK
ncbi:protein S100-A7-like [Ornithorhynchus anatinus]|uniref:protein S100-A7-like n=1 Tax=Ornithorhynchus anatinus TaxID=9258 RepID=UPI0010A786A4|nr:protein S100-A7-like [Ornithorhynchus anatinus]